MRKSAISPNLVIPLMAIYCFCNLDAQVAGFDRSYKNVEFERIGETEGVPKVSRCIFVDSKGFVWFGTDIGGLYRYNGYDFEAHKYSYNDSTSISSNWIYSILHEDSSGNLWINAGLKLNRYNRALNNFTRFDHNSDDPGSIIGGMITSVISDTEGKIWIGSYDRSMDRKNGGLCIYDTESDSFIRFVNDPDRQGGISSNYITCLHPGDSGSIWAGTLHSGIDRIIPAGDAAGYRIINYRFNKESTGREPSNIISSIAVDGEGVTWFGTGGGGLLKYDSARDELKRYWVHPVESSPGNYISLLSIDNKGELWLGTGDGLGKYDRLKDSIILYPNEPGNPYSITPGRVISLTHSIDGTCWVVTNNNSPKPSEGICRFDPATAIFENFRENRSDPGGLPTSSVTASLADSNGILWISTLDGGINRFDPNKRKFSLYTTGAGNLNGMPPGKIYSVLEDYMGILWIGTYTYGLYRLDRKSGDITNFTTEPGNPKSINDNGILCICEGDPGTLWLGGYGELKKLDTQTLEFKSYIYLSGIPDSITTWQIMSIYRDDSGILWLGMVGGGLTRFDPVTEEFRSVNLDTINQGTLYSGFVFYVTGNSNGTLWLGTPEGLVKYIPGEGENPDKHFIYRNDKNNTNSLSYDLVRMVTEDDSGNLWIATEGGGLNRFNIRDESFTIYTEADGLPSSIVQGILIDDSGNLWISTINGISEFNPGTGLFRNYDWSDGLQSNEFTFGTFYISSKGEMFFGGEKGINYFFPNSIKTNPNIPPVVLTGFLLNNKPVDSREVSPLKKSIEETKLIELRHNENFITFEFAALNYTNSHKNQYKYLMAGLDPDTVYAGTRRSADFPGMKPGSYTFWVTGSNNDGLWNEEGTSVKIIIHPPWWRSNLAYGLYLAMIFIGLTGFVRWRTWSLRRDKLKLEMQVKDRTIEIEKRDLQILEMDRIRTMFYTNISHEFRTLITLILSPVEAIMANQGLTRNDKRDLSRIGKNARRLMDLVNNLLDLSKLDSGKMRLQLIEYDINKVLMVVFSSFDSLAGRKKINYSYHVHEKEVNTYFDRGKLETILNNLLSNAFRYTQESGKIECIVSFHKAGMNRSSDQLEISISDTGPGIDETKLDLIFDRFYQANEQHFSDWEGTGIGLSVTHELVKLMHGEILVSSKPGSGTCFTINIPVGMDHLHESEYVLLTQEESSEYRQADELVISDISDIPEDEPQVQKGKSIHILVVEDNSDLRSYLKEQLENVYTIVEARDGEEGLRSALKIIPDLIISDVIMPGMDGVEFCMKIKTNVRTSHIPVILLTAMADIENKIKGLETGADDYITKPFDISELKTRVKNLINHHRVLRERYSSGVIVAGNDISYNSYDLQFINRITSVIEEHLGDFDFAVKDIQQKVDLSPSQLYRKLFALTGLSPSKFISAVRLKKAVNLMEEGNYSITRIALEVGFNNISYFSKCFRETYGVTPSAYLKQVSGGRT